MGPKLRKVIDQLLSDYEQRDTEGILFYSKDRERDFNNQRVRMVKLRRTIEIADEDDQRDARAKPPATGASS